MPPLSLITSLQPVHGYRHAGSGYIIIRPDLAARSPRHFVPAAHRRGLPNALTASSPRTAERHRHSGRQLRSLHFIVTLATRAVFIGTPLLLIRMPCPKYAFPLLPSARSLHKIAHTHTISQGAGLLLASLSLAREDVNTPPCRPQACQLGDDCLGFFTLSAPLPRFRRPARLYAHMTHMMTIAMSGDFR